MSTYQIPLQWYDIPGFPNYQASEAGEIRNKKTGRVLKTWDYRSGSRKDQKVNLYRDGVSFRKFVHRLVLSAKLGRTLEPWEHCCHGPGGWQDNSMANLSVGCALNNMLDDIECGKRKTSQEELLRALERIKGLLDRF